MSLVSLTAQLEALKKAGVKCDRAIVAMGTNDAWYGISHETFLFLMQETIALLRAMETNQIVLIPAFYSTVAATLNPLRAASIQRIDEINLLLDRAAASEKVTVASTENLALYCNGELREDLTTDGVHLNQQGCQIYREFLWEIYQTNRSIALGGSSELAWVKMRGGSRTSSLILDCSYSLPHTAW